MFFFDIIEFKKSHIYFKNVCQSCKYLSGFEFMRKFPKNSLSIHFFPKRFIYFLKSHCSYFDNDQLLWPEPTNPLDMMKNVSFYIVDQRFLYEK